MKELSLDGSFTLTAFEIVVAVHHMLRLRNPVLVPSISLTALVFNTIISLIFLDCVLVLYFPL